MTDVFIGLDLGTTGIKAVAFDADDRQLASATVPTPTHPLVDGGAEYDADELWTAASSVLRRTAADVAGLGGDVVAVATASMAESGVLVDGGGRPVAPVIAWFDARTEPQIDWWRHHIGAERTHRIAALPPRPVFGAAKMLWTKHHLPSAWGAGRHWLNMADWAAYRLTGTMATDHSLASRTMLYDLGNRSWSDELVDAAALDRARLAPLIDSGETVGRVHAQAADETGLPEGTVVGAGGQDHVCAALALGVVEPAMLLDSIGTAEAFFVVTRDPDLSGRVATAGIGQGAHVEPGRTYAMTGLAEGGGRIDAARRHAGLTWAAFMQTPEAALVVDDVATEGQERIAVLLDAVGLTEVRHLATGGGTRNAALMRRKRELGGREIEIAGEIEATALGAAHLARRAAEAN